MYIERINELGHDQIYQRAIANFEAYQRRLSRNPRTYDPFAGYSIGNFTYSSSLEGETFWRTLYMLGENGIDQMYDMFPEYLKPIGEDQPYKVRTNGLFANPAKVAKSAN